MNYSFIRIMRKDAFSLIMMQSIMAHTLMANLSRLALNFQTRAVFLTSYSLFLSISSISIFIRYNYIFEKGHGNDFWSPDQNAFTVRFDATLFRGNDIILPRRRTVA